MKKKDVPFHEEIVSACEHYKEAATAVNKAEGSAELKKWQRAAAGYAVKVAAEKRKQPFIPAVVSLSGISRSMAVMDTKCEEIRRFLKFRAHKLPVNSLSAFYELHRAREAAFLLAEDDAGKKKATKKLREIARSVVHDGGSVRAVRKAFADEHARASQERRLKGKKVQRAVPADATPSKPPAVQRLDAEALKALVDEKVRPSGIEVPLVVLVPADATAQAIDAMLAREEIRKAIADAWPAEKPKEALDVYAAF